MSTSSRTVAATALDPNKDEPLAFPVMHPPGTHGCAPSCLPRSSPPQSMARALHCAHTPIDNCQHYQLVSWTSCWCPALARWTKTCAAAPAGVEQRGPRSCTRPPIDDHPALNQQVGANPGWKPPTWAYETPEAATPARRPMLLVIAATRDCTAAAVAAAHPAPRIPKIVVRSYPQAAVAGRPPSHSAVACGRCSAAAQPNCTSDDARCCRVPTATPHTTLLQRSY
jgi:hypothetical protein